MTIAGRQGSPGTTLGAFGVFGNQFSTPHSAVSDSSGTYIYIADSYNHRIVQLSRTTLQTVLIAGTGNSGGDDGAGAVATFNRPISVVLFNSDSSLLVSTYFGYEIRRIDNILTSPTVSTVAGLYNTFGSTDGAYPCM
jgi:hypothetical protein